MLMECEHVNAPKWPLEELIDLYRSFLEMRQRASLDERRELSFRLVLHRASLVRLEKAAIGCTFCPLDLQADSLQEATLLLVESLSAESLAYADQGPDEFGSWYWT